MFLSSAIFLPCLAFRCHSILLLSSTCNNSDGYWAALATDNICLHRHRLAKCAGTVHWNSINNWLWSVANNSFLMIINEINNCCAAAVLLWLSVSARKIQRFSRCTNNRSLSPAPVPVCRSMSSLLLTFKTLFHLFRCSWRWSIVCHILIDKPRVFWIHSFFSSSLCENNALIVNNKFDRVFRLLVQSEWIVIARCVWTACPMYFTGFDVNHPDFHTFLSYGMKIIESWCTSSAAGRPRRQLCNSDVQ